MGVVARIRQFASRLAKAIKPGDAAWHGATVAVYVVALLIVAALFVVAFVFDFAWQKLPTFFVWTGVPVLGGLATILVAALVMRLPRSYRLALGICAPFVLLTSFPGELHWRLGAASLLLLAASLIGGGLAVLRRSRQQCPASAPGGRLRCGNRAHGVPLYPPAPGPRSLHSA